MFKKMVSLLLATTAVLSLVACGQKQPDNNSVDNTHTEQIDTLTIAITKDENSLTPFTYVSSTGTVVNSLIYDSLFTTDLNNKVVPWMVEDDFTVSEDYRSYTFTLLDGLKFHDGSNVTTADVEFSFTYPATQNVSSQRKICSNVESFDIVDEKTMTINLKDPDLTFLRTGLASMYIISKAQYENVEDATTVVNTMGSGMYKLEEYKVGEYYVMTAVDDYFKGKPAVNKINMPIMTDSNSVQSAILSGEIAAATSSIGVEMLGSFEANKDISVFSNPGYSPLIMNINNGEAPLDSKEFRSALTYAIDVEGIMKTLFGEYATLGTKGVIRSDSEYAVSGLDYVYDVEKAKKILDEAGFDSINSSGIRLSPEGKSCSFEILVYSGNTIRIRAAELVAENLKSVGIAATVKAMEMDTVDAYVWPEFEVSAGRNYDLAMWGWGSSMNPTFLVNMFSSNFDIGTQNVCGYNNSEVDKIIVEKFNKAATEQEMFDSLKEIQKIIADDPGLICFGYADSLQACNTAKYSGWKSGMGKNVINKYSFLG